MKIYSIEGNRFRLDGGSMFGNAPKKMWEKWIMSDEENRIPLASRAMLVKTDEYNILCETGIGNFFDEKMKSRFGIVDKDDSIKKSLEKIDLTPDDIDFVILSHLHFDHAGGLIEFYDPAKREVKLRFENAKYIVGREQFEHAERPHLRDGASYTPGLTDALKNSGRLLLIEEYAPPEIKDIVTFYKSSGHTPGQIHAIFNGSHMKVLFAGDLMPGVPWVNIPITMGYDRYPESLIDEKKKILERVARENWLVFFTHDPEYAAAFVDKNEKDKFIPQDKFKELKEYTI
jgi:glyoxylase-like metal-dependent hydrolase (beta-lactamase superfamily II)